MDHKLKRHTTAHVHKEPLSEVKKDLASKGMTNKTNLLKIKIALIQLLLNPNL